MSLSNADLPRMRLEEYIALHVRDVVTVVAKYPCQRNVTQLSQLFCNREIVGKESR